MPLNDIPKDRRDWTSPKVIELSVPGHYLGDRHEGVPTEGTTYSLRATVPPEHIRGVTNA